MDRPAATTNSEARSGIKGLGMLAVSSEGPKTLDLLEGF